MSQRSRTILVTLFWTAFFASLTILCLSAARFKQQGALKSIAVEFADADNAAYFMRPEDVEKEILDVLGPLANHTVGDVSCDVVEDALSQNPFIRNVEVFVTGNAILTARISQRKPILRVIADGTSFYLDENGERMPVSRYYTPRVHVLTGDGASKHAEEFLDVVRYIRTDETLNALISQLVYTSEGELNIIPNVGRMEIRFGKAEGITGKFDNLKAFYSDVLASRGWSQYNTVDLRFRDQIICKKNPTS